jgi:ABC-type cobalamin/Fe3+-siderophores transport system ATPase subunit
VGHLSGGELQRVAIAHCLVQEPEILLLDEPTQSLDWKSKSDILQLVKFIHKTRRLTTLFVTHDIEILPETCDRIVLMKDGIIWDSGTPETMLSDYNLSEFYDIPVTEVRRRRSEAVIV